MTTDNDVSEAAALSIDDAIMTYAMFQLKNMEDNQVKEIALFSRRVVERIVEAAKVSASRGDTGLDEPMVKKRIINNLALMTQQWEPYRIQPVATGTEGEKVKQSMKDQCAMVLRSHVDPNQTDKIASDIADVIYARRFMVDAL